METSMVVHDEDGVAVLEVAGGVSVDRLEEFRGALGKLREAGRKCVVLDLMECPFLASRVFPSVLELEQELDAAGMQLFLACREDLRRILKVLGLDRRLSICPDRGSCLEAAATVQGL